MLMQLPPGGFLVLGFLLAGKRVMERRTQQRKVRLAVNDAAGQTAAI